MKNNKIMPMLAICMLLPLIAQAAPLHAQLEQAVSQAVANFQTPKYYVPLVQLKEDVTSEKDGPEAGIFWVEIGGTNTADGYEPEFFYLVSHNKTELEGKDGPSGPFLEEIVPAIFNEAYRRFAADPRSSKATINQTRQLLTTYYRQVQKEKLADNSK